MSTSKKRLLFVTGTRADFGKLAPLAQASLAAGFEVNFFITGMHMMSRYGETRLEVRRLKGVDFFEFVNQREGDPLELILSKTILGFSDFVHEHRPDLVIIHGDRVEAMAASIVCAMRYIRSAHIEGGEVSGTIDESIRHCNTKLCWTHFVSNAEARERVLALGESPDHVFDIGSPELDVHKQPSGVSLQEVKSYYDISFEQYGIVVFHPVTSEQETMGAQAHSFFEALKASQRHFVVIAPNNDPGTEAIFSIIKQLPSDRFRLLPSMRFHYFSELMKNAALIVGNSSAGVREAPFLGVPSLDVGTRQYQRAQSPSIVNVSAFDQEGIIRFIQTQWQKRYPSTGLFGKGSASERFVQTLRASSYWALKQQKSFIEKTHSHG